MYMGTKTISIDLVAYEKLKEARRRPNESFSQVIKRARWDRSGATGATILELLKTVPIPSSQVLDELERAQREDTPPDEPWTE